MLTVGVVVGASVFETPAFVAGHVGSRGGVLGAWLLGGGVSLIGALCYAELASTYPHAGGAYHYLHRAFGDSLAFLFAWARLAVVQTGSIALLAFVVGDYASELWSLGPYSSSLYAAGAVAGLTGLHAAGIRLGKGVQRGLTAATVVGVLVLAAAGLFFASDAAAGGGGAPGAGNGAPQGGFGMAMVFVLLTYGGWNEAAYVSAELRDVGRNMVRALLLSIGLIAVLYVLVNAAYLRGLGVAGMSGSEAVAAKLMRATVGPVGAHLLSLLVVAAALSSASATIFTGARTSYALGEDFSLFAFLGRWRERSGTPARALWVQGAVVGLLVGLGALTRDGFSSMVDYTAPVFWLFFFLTGVALLVLRRRDPDRSRPFAVPLYPLTPLAFCAASLYMLWSSLTYTGVGALVGGAVLLVGGALLVVQKRTPRAAADSS
ncbi:MAG: amino acid permease [Bacteroidetes bacterium QS_7_67_15]|nr:MAG: amino acid permease [Bacteroidetes bacterium QS_7_67_15]